MIINTHVDSLYDDLICKFVKFLCKELKVLPREITIVAEDMDKGLGLCIDVDADTFLILVKTSKRNVGQVFTTIAHEMIHVKQYMNQDLGRHLDENAHIPYEQRWWEKEAFENAIPLLQKFSKKITPEP